MRKEQEGAAPAAPAVPQLIAALQPFADLAALYDDGKRGATMPDTGVIMSWPRLDSENELTVEHLRAARAAIQAAPALQVIDAPRVEEETLKQVCDLLGIGHLARTPSTILMNVANLIRRDECLRRVELKFFMVPLEPDEPGDEPGDTCLLNWGATPAQYVEQFGEALPIARQAQPTDRDAVLSEVESVIEQTIEDLLSESNHVSGAKFCLEAVRAMKSGGSTTEGAAS